MEVYRSALHIVLVQALIALCSLALHHVFVIKWTRRAGRTYTFWGALWNPPGPDCLSVLENLSRVIPDWPTLRPGLWKGRTICCTTLGSPHLIDEESKHLESSSVVWAVPSVSQRAMLHLKKKLRKLHLDTFANFFPTLFKKTFTSTPAAAQYKSTTACSGPRFVNYNHDYCLDVASFAHKSIMMLKWYPELCTFQP